MNLTSEALKELQEKAAEQAWVQEQINAIDVDIQDASLTQKGIVQLSNATNGTRENVAATEKAVKDAYDRGSAGVNAAAAAQAKADAAETPAGAQAKANAAEANAKNYVNLNAVRVMGGLAIGSDLNNVVTSGFYQLLAASNYTNVPSNMDWSILEVAVSGSYVIQTLTSVTSQLRMFRTRTEFSNGWSTWRKILQQSDYDALFQSVANGKQAIATAISGKGVAASGSDEFAVLANKISQIKTETPSGSVYVDFSQQDYMVWANTTQRYKIADIPAGVKMISFEYVSSTIDGIYLKVEQPLSAYVSILNVVLRDANGMELEVLNESRSTYGGRYFPRFLLNLVTNKRTYSSVADNVFPRPNPNMNRFDISTTGFDRSRPMVLEIKAQNPSPNDNTMRVTHMVQGTVSYA
ncbi:hypothetical protein CHH67_19690 [Paenibacillus campinasensis]|uniref:Phage tail protein n=2 Tax=Paenibacillus campinasensis TaxID=66347 RepID=A0A268EKR5_9BACL|nr:hypothetical protein CHH67_19690 [Paenibacillus campinasensis]